MEADFRSSRRRIDSCCGEVRAEEARAAYRPSLELHRETRAQTPAMVRELSQRQTDFVPAAGKWSVGDVLVHLILGQRLNLCYIAQLIGRKKAGQTPVLRLGFAEVDVSIGYLPKSMLPALEVPFNLLNTIFPRGVRDFMTRYRLVPTQHPRLTTPRHGRPVDELRHEMNSSLEEMQALLESHSSLDYGEMKILHPLLGNKSVAELLRFLVLHEQHHQGQINEIMTSLAFTRVTRARSCGTN